MMAKAKLVGEMSKGHQDGLWEVKTCVISFKTFLSQKQTTTNPVKSFLPDSSYFRGVMHKVESETMTSPAERERQAKAIKRGERRQHDGKNKVQTAYLQSFQTSQPGGLCVNFLQWKV